MRVQSRALQMNFSVPVAHSDIRSVAKVCGPGLSR